MGYVRPAPSYSFCSFTRLLRLRCGVFSSRGCFAELILSVLLTFTIWGTTQQTPSRQTTTSTKSHRQVKTHNQTLFICESKGLPTEILILTTLPTLGRGLYSLCHNELHWENEFSSMDSAQLEFKHIDIYKGSNSFPGITPHSISSQCTPDKYRNNSLPSQEESFSFCSSHKTDSRWPPNHVPYINLRQEKFVVQRSWWHILFHRDMHDSCSHFARYIY